MHSWVQFALRYYVGLEMPYQMACDPGISSAVGTPIAGRLKSFSNLAVAG